jgi:hypothetical protein
MASDPTTPHRLAQPDEKRAHPHPRPSASASYCSSECKISESGADVPRPRTMMWSTHSRRIDPISRSTSHSARVRPVQGHDPRRFHSWDGACTLRVMLMSHSGTPNALIWNRPTIGLSRSTTRSAHRPQRSGFDILRRRAGCVRAGADTDDVVGDIFMPFVAAFSGRTALAALFLRSSASRLSEIRSKREDAN